MLDEDDALGVMDDYVEEAFDEEDVEGGSGGGGSDGEDGGRRGLMRGKGGGIGALFGGGGKKAGGSGGGLRALPLEGASGRRALTLAKQGFSYVLDDEEEEEGRGPAGRRAGEK